MDPITIACFIGGVAIFGYFLRSSRSTTVVPEEHRVEVPPGGLAAIEFFWRPGCPFCKRLGSGLRSAGIPMHERNIWENDDDAAIVRSLADGNETVPTVIVGPLALVNPSVKHVKAALAEHAPHLV